MKKEMPLCDLTCPVPPHHSLVT